MPVLRRTKIVATLGPSTSTPERIEAPDPGRAGCGSTELSHGSADDHRERARAVREIAARQGPIRRDHGRPARTEDPHRALHRQAGATAGGPALHPVARPSKEAGTASIVGIDYPELVQDCRVGDELLLDDGRVVLVVDSVEGDEVRTTVTVGGPLSNNKGINRRGGCPRPA